VPLRFREEIQTLLRWGDCELNPAAPIPSARNLAATLRGKLFVAPLYRYKHYLPACSLACFSSVSIRFARLRLITYWSPSCHFHETLVQLECT
jgi:hypothetical protein